MVAKITFPKSIMNALNYNEKKVQKGKAECIAANNYLADVSKINFYQKIARFERLNMLNDRASTKTIHISLNFDPSEKINRDKLTEIANSYMYKIGFSEQPYLVYQHNDAGHPHVHIVSTTIREDGSRINTHNIGRNQSEKARKEIEENFTLVRAENQRLKAKITKPVDVSKVTYGSTETRESISKVVNAVIDQYRLTSLPEFNAVLTLFNVVADRGSEHSRIYKNGGLVYNIVNANGSKIGVPIKASALSNKPTLFTLTELFKKNEARKAALKGETKNLIEEVLKKSPANFDLLTAQLLEKHIQIIERKNKEGRTYGVTFIDHNTKCVFNGSELGKHLSASGIFKQLDENKIDSKTQEKNSETSSTFEKQTVKNPTLIDIEHSHNKNVLEHLLEPKDQPQNVPIEFLKKKKGKRKRNLKL